MAIECNLLEQNVRYFVVNEYSLPCPSILKVLLLDLADYNFVLQYLIQLVVMPVPATLSSNQDPETQSATSYLPKACVLQTRFSSSRLLPISSVEP